MKQTILVALLLVSFVGQGWADETNRNPISSAPPISRFEIIQSELAAKGTLKIDKYTGTLFQLVKGSTGLFWESIAAEKHSKDKTVANQANYQVFTSGLQSE